MDAFGRHFRAVKIEKKIMFFNQKNMARGCFLLFGLTSLALTIMYFIATMLYLNDYYKRVCTIIDYDTGSHGIRGIIQTNTNTKSSLKWQCGNLDDACFELYTEENPIGYQFNCWQKGTDVQGTPPYKDIGYKCLGYFIVTCILLFAYVVTGRSFKKWLAVWITKNCKITQRKMELQADLVIIMLLFLVIFGLSVGLGDYSKKFIKSRCSVTNYTEKINNGKIKTRVNVMVSNNYQDLLGSTGWSCKQSLHDYNEEKYMKDHSYRIYWNNPSNTYFVPVMVVTSILIMIFWCLLPALIRWGRNVAINYLRDIETSPLIHPTPTAPSTAAVFSINHCIPTSVNPPPYNIHKNPISKTGSTELSHYPLLQDSYN